MAPCGAITSTGRPSRAIAAKAAWRASSRSLTLAFMSAWKARIVSGASRSAAVATCSALGAQAPTWPRTSAMRRRTAGGISPQPTRMPVAQTALESASSRSV